MTTPWLRLGLVVALSAGGCSFSYSSKSLSDSSGSSSESSASSSGGESKEAPADTAYRDDVRDQTVAFVESGESIEALQANIGDVARRYGMADWEADPMTYVGMGAGLAVAKVSGSRLETLEHELAGSDPEHRRALRHGYTSVAR